MHSQVLVRLVESDRRIFLFELLAQLLERDNLVRLLEVNLFGGLSSLSEAQGHVNLVRHFLHLFILEPDVGLRDLLGEGLSIVA